MYFNCHRCIITRSLLQWTAPSDLQHSTLKLRKYISSLFWFSVLTKYTMRSDCVIIHLWQLKQIAQYFDIKFSQNSGFQSFVLWYIKEHLENWFCHLPIHFSATSETNFSHSFGFQSLVCIFRIWLRAWSYKHTIWLNYIWCLTVRISCSLGHCHLLIWYNNNLSNGFLLSLVLATVYHSRSNYS